MAILQELRWLCDYCGNKSPVMEQDQRYRNWIEEHITGQTYGVGRQLSLHFCCNEHYVNFMAEMKVP